MGTFLVYMLARLDVDDYTLTRTYDYICTHTYTYTHATHPPYHLPSSPRNLFLAQPLPHMLDCTHHVQPPTLAHRKPPPLSRIVEFLAPLKKITIDQIKVKAKGKYSSNTCSTSTIYRYEVHGPVYGLMLLMDGNVLAWFAEWHENSRVVAGWVVAWGRGWKYPHKGWITTCYGESSPRRRLQKECSARSTEDSGAHGEG